jgi:hypothetical protein
VRYIDLYSDQKLKQTIAVNEGAKVIYLRTPRTASTSIFRSFLEFEMKGFIDMKSNPDEYDRWAKSLTGDSLNEYFIFTSVRDPYDRVISMLNHHRLRIKGINFLLSNYDNLFLDNHKYRMHIEPFSILSFFNSEKQFDFEIRYESLNKDFKELCKLLQVKHKRLKYRMVSKGRKHHELYYNKKLIKMVNKIYKSDFKFHNYKMVRSFSA